MYLRVPHVVLETCRNLAATSINAEWPSGNAPTTFVRRLASLRSRSIGLLVLIFSQCCVTVRASHLDRRAPVMWKQILEIRQLRRWQALQYVAQVSLRVQAVDLRRLDQ